MTFDQLVADLEKRTLPLLEAAQELICGTRMFRSAYVRSLRHAEIVHAIGIRCVPIWAADDNECLSFSTVVSEWKQLNVRASISWSKSFNARTGAGYFKRESRALALNETSPQAVDDFQIRWTKYLSRFLIIAERGRPRPRWIRAFHGAEPDILGRAGVANQLPDPMTASVTPVAKQPPRQP